MILRELALSLRRRDWGAVVIEIGIVVVGIFLGLQVDDWSRAREDRQSEMQYAVRLVEDVDRLRATNARIAVVAAERIADLERALATIRGSTLDATAVPALRDQLSSLDFYPGLDTDSPVLAEFIGTGNLRVVQDPHLRVRINEMAALLGEITRDDSAHFDMFLGIRADTHRALVLTPTRHLGRTHREHGGRAAGQLDPRLRPQLFHRALHGQSAGVGGDRRNGPRDPQRDRGGLRAREQMTRESLRNRERSYVQ